MSDQPLLPVPALTDGKSQADKRFFGLLIMVASGLVATLCGLCTLAFVSTPQSWNSDTAFYSEIALVLGGVPTVAGGAGFLVELAVYRSAGPRWPKDDPRQIAWQRSLRRGIAIAVFATVAIYALWNFGGQILFAAAGFGIARWMFLRATPDDDSAARQTYLAGGGLLAAVAVFGLWLRDADMLFEGVGFAIALWLYRLGGREMLGLK